MKPQEKIDFETTVGRSTRAHESKPIRLHIQALKRPYASARAHVLCTLVWVIRGDYQCFAYTQAERLLQIAIDSCLSLSPSSNSPAPDTAALSPPAAMEYALALKRYFEFLLGVRGDLQQCAQMLRLLASLHRSHGVAISQCGRGGGAEETGCQRKISAMYFTCKGRLHWVLAMYARGAEEGKRQAEEEMMGDNTRRARTPSALEKNTWGRGGARAVDAERQLLRSECCFVQAYRAAVAGPIAGDDEATASSSPGSRKASPAPLKPTRQELDLDLAAGEVATSLAWVAVEAARFRDAEDLAVISLRHRGLMAAVRPSVLDHGMQDGSPSRARLEAWGAREAAAMFVGAGPWGPAGKEIWAVVVEKAAHLGEVLAVRARALSARGSMTQAELCLERGLRMAPRNAFLVHQLAAFLVGVRADAPAAYKVCFLRQQRQRQVSGVLGV